MSGVLPLIIVISYAAALFAFASWVERGAPAGVRRLLRPPAYALALAVYCTSWTFYGAVGSAVTEGWNYLPIYLGPMLVFLLTPGFLRRFVDAVKSDGANSISEFIGGRFGNSRGVAALVTLLALAGSIPYLALQLRSLGGSYAMIAAAGDRTTAIVIAALGLTLFALVYGTRRYQAASRNDSVLFAVGFESLLKLAALLVAGGVALSLMSGLSPQVQAIGIARLTERFSLASLDGDFFVITLLSMAAILCLPRQFSAMVVEAESGEDILRARWPFLLYMLLTLLVVLPISAAGLSLFPAASRPDGFVLALPLSKGLEGAALFIFLGGFAAATSMVLVETIALATMVSNDLIAPILMRGGRLSGEGEVGRVLLNVRRLAISAIMLAALLWAMATPDNARLSAIGLVAFAAMAQFAPALMLAVYRSNRDAMAAKAGLVTGFIIWGYTLALPLVLAPGALVGVAGTLLDPNALFGISGFSPISHGTIWSLGGNFLAFTLVTMRRVQTGALPSLLREAGRSTGTGPVGTVADLRTLVARFVGPETADDVFASLRADQPVDRVSTRRAERMIASVVGVPSARVLMRAALHGSNLTHDDVARILDDTGQSLRFSKGLLAATLENIDPGVSVIDKDLRLVAWNSRYLDLFQYPPGMVHVGAPVADLIRYNARRGECGPGEVEAHVEKRLGHMRRGQVHSFQRTRPDGRVLKTVGGPMPGGGYVMCFTDVTAEAQALAELERARAELESRVEERTQALREANGALAKADAEKTRFLAAASHDLLQPIHAARLFSAALGRDAPVEKAEIVQRLDRAIDSADHLLRALLDISRLDAGGVTPMVEKLRVRPILLDIADTFAPLAREKGLDLRVGPGDADIVTDPGLFRSIIQNFLSNAIRYTAQGGIVMGVRWRGQTVRIDVIDTGPGIPDDHQDLIFREFERLPNSAEGGIGLGLAIVDRTSRLLGARVTLRSQLGRGSRFSLSLPGTVPDPSIVCNSAGPPALASTPKTILVVDDDADNRLALESYLASLGHRVSSVAGPREALAMPHGADIALIDFDLGAAMNGLDLIEQLTARAPHLCAALVTASDVQAYAARAELLGVTVLRKPVDTRKLNDWLAAVP